jgi:hypothetical protein
MEVDTMSLLVLEHFQYLLVQDAPELLVCLLLLVVVVAVVQVQISLVVPQVEEVV